MALTATQVNELETKALSLRSRLQKLQQQGTAQVEKAVQTVEFSTSAFGFGLIDGRWGGVELLGMPLTLLATGVFHGIGFLGVASPHMHAFGNGALANYLTVLGQGIGAKMAAEAQKAA